MKRVESIAIETLGDTDYLLKLSLISQYLTQFI